MSNDTQPWYRHRWPWLLMIGPVAVLIAGFITTWISFAGADALVVDDYYKKGKAINQDLRRDRSAAALGLAASIRYDAAAGALAGRVDGLPRAGTIVVQLIHPTVPAKDVRLSVSPDAAGNFSASLPLFDRARWQVQLEDVAGEWRLHGDWQWPEQKNIDVRPIAEIGQGA